MVCIDETREVDGLTVEITAFQTQTVGFPHGVENLEPVVKVWVFEPLAPGQHLPNRLAERVVYGTWVKDPNVRNKLKEMGAWCPVAPPPEEVETAVAAALAQAKRVLAI